MHPGRGALADELNGQLTSGSPRRKSSPSVAEKLVDGEGHTSTLSVHKVFRGWEYGTIDSSRGHRNGVSRPATLLSSPRKPPARPRDCLDDLRIMFPPYHVEQGSKSFSLSAELVIGT